MTREELQKRLWPDTFVDVNHNPNTAINKIREVLGDSAESPPALCRDAASTGYRFIGELEAPMQPIMEPVAVVVEPDRGGYSRRVWLKIAAGFVAILVTALAAGVAYRWFRQQRPHEQEALTAVPFTALPGQASAPAFLPMAPELLSHGTVILHPGLRVSTYL